MELLLIGLVILMTAINVIIFIHFTKIKENGTHKKEKNLHTPKRWLSPINGNKKLTPEQQRELFIINQKNLNTLKQFWKNEHL